MDKPTVAAGAWNKELLPHQGRHPNKYHDFVLGGMNQAARKAKSDKGIFLELFESYVKEPVRLNPDLLSRIGWEERQWTIFRFYWMTNMNMVLLQQ